MLKMIKKALLLSIGGFLLINLTACNTVEGFGQDMQQGGKALQHAAKSNNS